MASPKRTAPPRPDRFEEDKIKTKYKRLQVKHADLLSDGDTLRGELQKAERKMAKLQSECDLILDQLLDARSPMSERNTNLSDKKDDLYFTSEEEDINEAGLVSSLNSHSSRQTTMYEGILPGDSGNVVKRPREESGEQVAIPSSEEPGAKRARIEHNGF